MRIDVLASNNQDPTRFRNATKRTSESVLSHFSLVSA